MNNRLLTKTLKFKNTEQMSCTVSMLALSPVVSLRLHFIQPSISSAKKKLRSLQSDQRVGTCYKYNQPHLTPGATLLHRLWEKSVLYSIAKVCHGWPISHAYFFKSSNPAVLVNQMNPSAHPTKSIMTIMSPCLLSCLLSTLKYWQKNYPKIIILLMVKWLLL